MQAPPSFRPESELDITDLLSAYREAVRHLWNSLFAGSDLACFDSVDEFAEISDRLFEAVVTRLVIARAGLESDDEQCASVRGVASAAGGGLRCRHVQPDLRGSLRVVPSIPHGTPVMIENPRDGDRNHYWDHPVTEIRPKGTELGFLGYFDWDSLGIRDYRYYMVEILRCADHPELEQRRALIDVCHATVTAQKGNRGEPVGNQGTDGT